MTRTELLAALNRLKVETGSLACLGCGHEHNCSTQGCSIIREAAALLKLDAEMMEEAAQIFEAIGL